MTCTEHVLVLHVPVLHLPEPGRSELIVWLVEHGVDPVRVAVGGEIERCPDRARLVWHEQTVAGVERRRWRLAPQRAGSWPAPFPATVVALLTNDTLAARETERRLT